MSCILDDATVREEVRFIENNPLRQALADRPEDYAWSSARTHVMGDHGPILNDGCFLMGEIADWRAYLEGKGNEANVSRARAGIKTGRPAGNAEFIRKLEVIIGRRIEALPRGRPRNSPQISLSV